MSQVARKKDIRINRQEERERVHAAEAWTPQTVATSALAPEDDLIAHLSHAEWIRRTQTTIGGAHD